jgi:hypothetical protein
MDKANVFLARLLYRRWLSDSWAISSGLGLGCLGYKIHFQKHSTSLNRYSTPKIDTLDVYYVEQHGKVEPYYITEPSIIEKTDTLRSSTFIDSSGVQWRAGIPIQVEHVVINGGVCYFSALAGIEPSLVLYQRGLAARGSNAEPLSTKNTSQLCLAIDAGLKTGLFLTERISVDALFSYRFYVQGNHSKLPVLMLQQQFSIKVGASYSF